MNGQAKWLVRRREKGLVEKQINKNSKEKVVSGGASREVKKSYD